MKVTLDKLYRINDKNKLKGSASVIIDDCFKVTGIKIIQGEEKLFLSMPNRTSKDGTKIDIAYPINAETRKLFEDVILAEYNKEAE